MAYDLQFATLHHVDNCKDKPMTTEGEEPPCFIIHPFCFFMHLVIHVLPSVLTGCRLLTLLRLEEYFQQDRTTS